MGLGQGQIWDRRDRVKLKENKQKKEGLLRTHSPPEPGTEPKFHNDYLVVSK